MPITAFFAALCAFLLVALTLRVAKYRHYNQVSSGGEDRVFNRWVRAHGNAAEQIPITLILMGLAESLAAPAWLLILLGLMLIIGRSLHAWHFSFKAVPLAARACGMGLTLCAQLAGAVAILVLLM